MERLKRRLRSTRGTAYLEFCVFAPIILFAFLFAADFTRVLYVEQQVEIASRMLCDIECHLRPGDRDKDGVKNSGCPGRPAKRVVRAYLASALGHEGLFSQAGDCANSVYCRGSYGTQMGPLHKLHEFITKILKNQHEIDNLFFRILAKVFGGFIKILTLGTVAYLTDYVETDKVVKTSVSVLIQPVAPFADCRLFGLHDTEGVMLIPAAAPRLGDKVFSYNRPLSKTERVRYYCHMPSLDTLPLAPFTFVRRLTKVFGRWIKE